MTLEDLLRRPDLVPVPSRGARLAFALGVAFAILAALSPVFGGTAGDAATEGADVVVCLDVSRSMLAKDVDPDRLSRAKREIAALAKAARGERLALVVFAGEARALVPLTADAASFAAIAAEADPTSVGRGGTDLGAALETALSLLSTRGKGPAAVVLLTDGEDLSGRGLSAAEKLKERGVRVHALGLGTPLGGKIAANARSAAFLTDKSGREVVSSMDAASLRRIADATGGTFVEVGSGGTPLADLVAQSVVPAARSTTEAGGREKSRNRFQGPLLAAVLCFAFGLARPARLAFGARRGAATVLALAFLSGCDGGAEARAKAATDAREAFLRGNAAFSRSVAAEAEAGRPGGEPTAMEAARALAEDALASWRFAAMSRSDWPAARRNVERALLRIDRLREKKAGDGTPPAASDRLPPKPPPSGANPEEPPKETEARVVTTELPAGDVLRLVEILREQERKKQALRRLLRERADPAVERDW